MLTDVQTQINDVHSTLLITLQDETPIKLLNHDTWCYDTIDYFSGANRLCNELYHDLPSRYWIYQDDNDTWHYDCQLWTDCEIESASIFSLDFAPSWLTKLLTHQYAEIDEITANRPYTEGITQTPIPSEPTILRCTSRSTGTMVTGDDNVTVNLASQFIFSFDCPMTPNDIDADNKPLVYCNVPLGADGSYYVSIEQGYYPNELIGSDVSLQFTDDWPMTYEWGTQSGGVIIL